MRGDDFRPTERGTRLVHALVPSLFRQGSPWLTSALLAGTAVHGVLAAPPILEVRRVGTDQVLVTPVDAVVEDGWVLQHSYDGNSWWDLVELTGEPTQVSPDAAPSTVRLFRAARKPLATGQEALAQARERWSAAGMRTYQFRSQTSVSGFLTDDLTLVRDGRVVESTSLLPPGFPPFAWGDQSIEDLFDRLQRALDQDAHMMTASYDPEWGHPTMAYVDLDEWIADEEWGVSIVEPPTSPEVLLGNAELRWRQAGIEAYDFTLRHESGAGSWQGTIRVAAGEVSVLAGGEPPAPHVVMPLEGYLATIRESLAGGKVTSALYDPRLGFPHFFSRDWHLVDQGGPGERFWISSFEVLQKP